MRIRSGIILAAVAFAVGGVAGWFASRALGGAAVSSKPPYRDATSREDNIGRARSMNAPNGRVASPHAADAAAKPRRKVEVRAEKRQEPVAEVAKPEEKPVQAAQTEQQKKDDNPFPRYLDMFKDNPEALVVEFQKEAEIDRASLAKMREHAIGELKLNAEQVAMFEKALDDLRDEVTRTNEEWVELIKSGQLNDEDDGSILTSNRLLGERFVAAREKAFRETAEKLYEQLTLDGVSDAKKQSWLYIATSRTAHSYECLEPTLAVYDKVYKNYGIGDSIFSWCRRQRQQQEKK